VACFPPPGYESPIVAPATGARPVLLLVAGREMSIEREKYNGICMESGYKVGHPSQMA
jgi:hypothetical protein